ncbi:MAG: ATP-binding protein [Oligoflexia bacterium]|nr:ATP-binding protein [Oligoflexia bacterium]
MNSRLSSLSKIKEIVRVLKLLFEENPLTGSAAVFLWGARKTGKTTLLKQQFKNGLWFNLLNTDTRIELSSKPSTLREIVLGERPRFVIIDEVQKVPALLDEVHWLLENTSTKFVLCGSSARKLKRGAANLLGGRALKYELFPLTSKEVGIDKFDLNKILSYGSIPSHYLSKNPWPQLKSYTSDYLQEEIIEESKLRNIAPFSKFLNVAALTNGDLLNYANAGSECGVSGKTIREYYQILIDSLLGYQLDPWKERKDRRLIETAKFYLIDIGIVNYLQGKVVPIAGTPAYGRAFEHFIINEVKYYASYSSKDFPLSYWRTSTGFEVDLILGNMEIAIEIKSTKEISSKHFRSLRALKEESSPKRSILVSIVERSRRTEDGIEVLNYRKFLSELWSGKII